MAIYYTLDESEMKIKSSEIGSVMMNVNKQLWDDYGLTLNLLAISSLEEYCELLNGLKDGTLQYVTEEILWKNMTSIEKAKKKLLI